MCKYPVNDFETNIQILEDAIGSPKKTDQYFTWANNAKKFQFNSCLTTVRSKRIRAGNYRISNPCNVVYCRYTTLHGL